MILSIDATLAFALTCTVLATLFTATQNLDFAIDEIVAQQLASDLALALQKEKHAILAMQSGNLEPMHNLLENLEQNSNCIEATTAGKKHGNCTGEKVTRDFLIYNNGLIQAQVAVYLK